MSKEPNTLGIALAATLLVATTIPAIAEQRPVPLPADGRIKQFVYNENTVYRLDMHTNFISTVQFGKGEVVESIQVGDSASWQIIRLKRGDVISIKPLNQDAVTNMTVYTDRRVYSFELRAHRGRAGHRQNHNFRTTFRYPTGVVSEYHSASTSNGGKNFDYWVAGEAAFSPIEVYDNGKQTFFRFPNDAPLPGIFRVGKAGREYIVNSRTAGRTIIADGVHKNWTVRIGSDAICVSNGPSPTDPLSNILG
ncbi:MAG: TrbG/VirB9 family P-type conjugative transfer protein [Ahrensia sp.]|nr:TrbG/VirB9 family P-type conjugative transfer protein [Ahrensia sp.]